MLTSDELKNAKLGQSFDSKDLERCCKAIYGGVAWPNKRQGFAVVVAMNRFEKYGTEEHEICLLDEFESADMYELVRWCGGADSKYNPSVWIGDRSNPTADQFIRELNRETHGHRFSIQRTRILDMDRPYQHILQSIRRMLRDDSRTLFLKDSRVRDYLGQVGPDEETELELGEYPAIEALAFAVLEMRNRRRGNHITAQQARALSDKYRKRY
jgi:hypothetical protein